MLCFNDDTCYQFEFAYMNQINRITDEETNYEFVTTFGRIICIVALRLSCINHLIEYKFQNFYRSSLYQVFKFQVISFINDLIDPQMLSIIFSTLIIIYTHHTMLDT